MPLAKAILDALTDDTRSSSPYVYDKILSLAFRSPRVTCQDMHNKRLDYPFLTRMGPNLWRNWALSSSNFSIYGGEAPKITEHVLADIRPGDRKTLTKRARGGEFLRGMKMQELREASPQVYEAVVAATQEMEFGSCVDCEHCRRGVMTESGCVSASKVIMAVVDTEG